jgi:hypothetical protein
MVAPAPTHLLISLVVLVGAAVQVALLRLATAAQVAIPVVVVVAVAQGTQSTPVLAAMVATAMSVL